MDSVDVVVVARDGADYLMDDGGGRLERITAPALAQARNTRKADKHWQGHVVVRGGAVQEAEALTIEVVRQSMGETAAELLSQQAPPGVPAGYAKNFGILGMSTWAQRLTDPSSKRGWMRIFSDPKRSAAGMDMLHGLLAGKRFSGPGALRPLYGQFLAEVAGGEDVAGAERAALQELAAQYAALGEHWDALTALIGAEGTPDFAAMASRVEAIGVLEDIAARALQSAARGGS